MLNKKLNLSLKLNSILGLSHQASDQPFTPLEQTIRTPLDPMVSTPQLEPTTSGYFGNAPQMPSNGLYQQCNESDDILTDVDEPIFGLFKSTKNYTLQFNDRFDELLLATYQHFLMLPTTTPFQGSIPPSGLVLKISNETLSRLISAPNVHYDMHQVMNEELLKSSQYRPIFLQLIRKRLIDLCGGNDASNLTSVTITTTNGANGVHLAPYTTNARQLSILNLSLNELNINACQNPQSLLLLLLLHQQFFGAGAGSGTSSAGSSVGLRLRSSLMALRKQLLTRGGNGNAGGSSWLHVGNLAHLKPEFHDSTDLLQLIQDFVPQQLITKQNNQATSQQQQLQLAFNSMMMDYQTPPLLNKSSISHITPPQGLFGEGLVDDFTFSANRLRLLSRGMLPRALNINTDVGAPNNVASGRVDALDLPFMLATTPLDEGGYFSNGFAQSTGQQQQPERLPQSMLASGSPMSDDGGAQRTKDPINLPSQFSLSEKKRDSLKLKRGIH